MSGANNSKCELSEEPSRLNSMVAILKIVASFAVVWIHYGYGCGRLTQFAFPIFAFLALYFSSDKLVDGDWHFLVRRLKRISIPFFFWGALCWLVFGTASGKLDVVQLVWQLTFGHAVCLPLYFMPILATITVICFFVCKLQKGVRVCAFVSIMIMTFLLQHSGVNSWLCDRLPFVMKYTCGRFVELMPVAVMGLLAKWLESDKRWLNDSQREVEIGLLVLALGFICALVRPIRVLPGYGYGGVCCALIAGGVCLVIIGGGRLHQGGAWVKTFSALSSGVYLSHIFVGWTLRRVGLIWEQGAVAAIAVFVCAVLVVSVIMKLPVLRKLAL